MTRERDLDEELADLVDQRTNIDRRIEQLRALKSERENFMTPALRHPGFRQWRERRGRERE